MQVSQTVRTIVPQNLAFTAKKAEAKPVAKQLNCSDCYKPEKLNVLA